MSLCIDLNCDVGEGFGPYKIGNDKTLLDFVTSANVACGFHAGDPATMRETVQMTREKNVVLGAHPGLPDRVRFGRRRWDITPQEAYDLVLYQIGALAAFAQAEHVALRHVKPHGALYNMAAQDRALAVAIAQAVANYDRHLILYGLAGSELIGAGLAIGLRVAREAFLDRTYEQDGSLTPRSESAAVITDTQQAVDQALRIVRNQTVVSRQGATIRLQADTLCIHGDCPSAMDLAASVWKGLEKHGIELRALVPDGGKPSPLV